MFLGSSFTFTAFGGASGIPATSIQYQPFSAPTSPPSAIHPDPQLEAQYTRRPKSQRFVSHAAVVDPFQQLTASMLFSEAADVFLASQAAPNAHARVQYIATRTYKDLENTLKTLKNYFGDMRLESIHPGDFSMYQKARANGEGFYRSVGAGRQRRRVPSPAGAVKINSELSVLGRVLKASGAWTVQMQQLYRRLQVPDKELAQTLSITEQARFISFAASIPDARVVWWYALVALHTCFSSDEMRTIRQGDINLTSGILGVNRRHGKNTFRRREVALSDDKCIWALGQLLARSIELAGEGPQIYLFPFRSCRGSYDGTRPMGETGLRKAFDLVRECAGVPWFPFNGFRHTAITRLAEGGVPISVIQRRAGHTSPKMTQHYTHISEQFERKEMERLARRSRSEVRRESTRSARPAGVVLQMDGPVTPSPSERSYLDQAAG